MEWVVVRLGKRVEYLYWDSEGREGWSGSVCKAFRNFSSEEAWKDRNGVANGNYIYTISKLSPWQRHQIIKHDLVKRAGRLFGLNGNTPHHVVADAYEEIGMGNEARLLRVGVKELRRKAAGK